MSIDQPQLPWPEGVLARFLTIAGEILRDPTVTVDVTDTESFTGDTSTATCTACGSEYTNSRCYRTSTVLTWAQNHAAACRALPRPTT